MGLDDFPATQWSQVIAASSRDPARARAAGVALAAQYRNALCAWFRHDARTRAQAEDLAHDFLARWLAHDAPLGSFTRGERRFREFLAVCLRRFAAARLERDAALKRGGGAVHVSLAEEDAVVAAAPAVDALDLALARELNRAVFADLAARWAPRLPAGGWPRLCARPGARSRRCRTPRWRPSWACPWAR